MNYSIECILGLVSCMPEAQVKLLRVLYPPTQFCHFWLKRKSECWLHTNQVLTQRCSRSNTLAVLTKRISSPRLLGKKNLCSFQHSPWKPEAVINSLYWYDSLFGVFRSTRPIGELLLDRKVLLPSVTSVYCCYTHLNQDHIGQKNAKVLIHPSFISILHPSSQTFLSYFTVVLSNSSSRFLKLF